MEEGNEGASLARPTKMYRLMHLGGLRRLLSGTLRIAPKNGSEMTLSFADLLGHVLQLDVSCRDIKSERRYSRWGFECGDVWRKIKRGGVSDEINVWRDEMKRACARG
jgi:hypothetical protein